MIKVKDLISTALKEINAIATGEVPTADEIQDSLKKLQGVLSSWSIEGLPLLEVTSAAQSLELEPGWQLAIETNLAIALCPQFGKAASAELAMIAGKALSNIKKKNLKKPVMVSDLMHARTCPDILAGE